MTYGKIVAKRYKKQYCKRKKWNLIPNWEMQPEQIHLILIELKSKAAIDALMGNNSWSKNLPKKSVTKSRSK